MGDAPDPGRLGDLIRRRRTQLQLSQSELAERSGVSVRTVSNVELGKVRRPHPHSLRLIAAALGADGLGAATKPPPSLLPCDVQDFTGRATELGALDQLLLPRLEAAPMRLAVATGTAGVGKTALAVHWAHRAAAAFPDGQLYVDLRGYALERAADPQDVLGDFLRWLGLGAGEIPSDVAGRAGLFRSLVASRRMLVVLDNANSAEQLRPLLPGSPGCSVLVTSRDSLPALVARDGARRLAVDVLTAEEAVALLRRLLGSVVQRDIDGAGELVKSCARLPLALRIVADHAATTGRPLAAIAQQLKDRLTVLEAGGDPRTGVRSVFSWSVGELPAGTAGAFRLFGLVVSADIDEPAFAALIGLDLAGATEVADQLVRAHLLHRAPGGRLTMHDLLRVYASELLQAEESKSDRELALDRLHNHLRWSVELALGTVRGDRTEPAGHRPATVVAPVDGQHAASWLDAERPVLAWLVARAAASDRPADAIELAAGLWQYLYLGGYHADAVTIESSGVQAARRLGDSRAEGAALRRLGILYKRAGNYSAAVGCADAAIAAFQTAGARVEEGEALNDLGVHLKRWGRLGDAMRAYSRSLDIFVEAGRQDYTARVLNNLGLLYELRGDYVGAREQHEKALTLSIDLGERDDIARARCNLGQDLLRLNELSSSARHLEQALTEFTALGDRDGRGVALHLLGELAIRAGRPADAVTLGLEAVRLRHEVFDRDGAAEATIHLGNAYHHLGEHESAIQHYRAALDLATALGADRLRAGALNGIGQCRLVLDRAAAVEVYERALVAADAAADTRERARALEGLAEASDTGGTGRP